MKDRFYCIYEKLKKEYKDHHYSKVAGIISLATMIVAIAIILFTLLMYFVISFFVYNWKFIIIVVGGFITLCYIVYKKIEEQRELRKIEQELVSQQQEETDQKIVERNYNIIRNSLFNVLLQVQDVLHIKRPNTVQELDTPNHYIRKTNYILYQYVSFFSVEMKTNVVKEVIQNEIERKLIQHEVSGIAQIYYIYESVSYPIIMVDSVEKQGVYYIISLAIADKAYCSNLRQKVSVNLLQHAEQLKTLSDKDF